MSLLDKIAAHAASKPPVAVKVPEWGTTLYFRPITAAVRRRCYQGIDRNDETALILNTLIETALDADGKRVFEGTPQERATLEGEADFAVIARTLSKAGQVDEGDDAVDLKNG